MVLSKPGWYNLNAVVRDSGEFYLLGKPLPVEVVDVNVHYEVVKEMRRELSAAQSLKEPKEDKVVKKRMDTNDDAAVGGPKEVKTKPIYPFFVVPWTELKTWHKFKAHEACLNDDSLTNFAEMKVQEPMEGR